MATIAGILEGKTGNYFKLEDLGEEPFTILESIDPKKTDIRTEKVPNKDSTKKDTEYFHINGKCGDVEKDLSLTFTALKQFAAVMPREENWKGYQFKYLGTKGSGKNIKYNYQILGKAQGEQARLGDKLPLEAAILAKLSSPGIHESRLWDDGMLKDCGALGEVISTFDNLKRKGAVTQKPDGCWVRT